MAPMRQTSFADFHCSLARSLEVVGDWWTPLIVRDVAMGLNRFDELVEDLGISRNLLATRLEDLETNGILQRRQYHERPPRFEYTLTKAGAARVSALNATASTFSPSCMSIARLAFPSRLEVKSSPPETFSLLQDAPAGSHRSRSMLARTRSNTVVS